MQILKTSELVYYFVGSVKRLLPNLLKSGKQVIKNSGADSVLFSKIKVKENKNTAYLFVYYK